MSGKYDQIKNMSIDELKDEYYNCSQNDKVKKEMLKKLIKSKITIEKQKRQQMLINSEKQKKEEKCLSDKINKSIDKLINLKNHSETIKQSQKLKTLEPIIKKRGNMEQYWESNQNTKGVDPKFVKEIGVDHSNNKLMERLNCELDFRIFGDKNENNVENDIVKPYSNSEEGNFKDFEKYSIPITSFVPRKNI